MKALCKIPQSFFVFIGIEEFYRAQQFILYTLRPFKENHKGLYPLKDCLQCHY
jgi:hypothetical protein